MPFVCELLSGTSMNIGSTESYRTESELLVQARTQYVLLIVLSLGFCKYGAAQADSFSDFQLIHVIRVIKC